MLRTLLLVLAGVPATVALAQTTAVVPSACATLPGNAALSMPLRWSQGTMQVRVDAVMLPAGFVGQTITGLQLRRPTLLGDVAYGPLQRTLTVRGGFQPELALTMGTNLVANRPATWSVLFGPAAVAVAATPAPGPAATVGTAFVHIQFAQPLPVVAGTLFLEFESSDAPLHISTDHWVDAVWLRDGNETGYASTFGDGSCTTRPEATELRWNDALQGPHVSGTAALEVRGVPPSGVVLAWAGLDPQSVAPAGIYAGFGGALSGFDPGLVGCYQWAPLQTSWFGVADTQGRFATSFPLTGTATVGLRIGVQTAWYDPSRTGLPLSFSNGLLLVLNSIAVGNHCNTTYFPGTATASPWVPFVGQMPVLTLEY